MKSGVVKKESHSGKLWFPLSNKDYSWKEGKIPGLNGWREGLRYRVAVRRKISYRLRINCERPPGVRPHAFILRPNGSI